MNFISSGEVRTRSFAQKLIAKLKGGETLCLVGDLGSGKTAFVKGLAQGLRIKKIITSPTFVLMKVYAAGDQKIKTLVHVDAYRLTSGQELLAIGLADYLGQKDTLVVIEWADRVRDVWPLGSKIIKFETVGKNKRNIFIV